MSNGKIVTPLGDLEWINIDGEGVENLSGKMVYRASLVLDGDKAEALKAKIDTFWKENKPSGFKKPAKSLGYKDHTVKNQETDEYEETGKTVFTFSTATTFPDGQAKVIKTYNAKNRVVALGETKIGNGSKGAISGVMAIYGPTKTKEAGVSLYIDAIQITKLVEFSQDAGFGAVDDEDGWTGDDHDFQSADDSENGKVRI